MNESDLARRLDAPSQREEEHHPREEQTKRQAPVWEADAVADVVLRLHHVIAAAVATGIR